MSPTSSRPKIVVLSCFYTPYISGAERFVKEVVERLSGRFDFFIVTARLNRKNSKKETVKVGDGSYEIRRIGFGIKLDRWFYMVLAPFYAMAVHPKIVHAVMESYAGVALMLYKWIGGKGKTILTLQSGDLDSENKQWKIPGFLWRGIHRTPDFVTAISSFLRDRAVRLGAKADRVSIIPNGVDLNSIETKPNPVPNRIVSVARLSWEKGLDFLIKALPAIKKEFPKTELVIIGGGPLENELKNLVGGLNLSDTIKFSGNQPHERALEEISKAEVFITPSLAEGLGIVFIEAQALGVPVIGTNVGGIPDVIQNEETGILIRSKDSEAISSAIIKVFKNKDLAQKLVRNAKEKIGRFDWDVISNQVSNLYSSLI
jgi:glycosyltransferase involved in cell wall biosynthesis